MLKKDTIGRVEGRLPRLYYIKAPLQWIGIVLGILYWFLESALDAFLFHQNTFLKSVFTPDANELWMRLVIICLFVIFSYYAQTNIRRLEQAEAIKRSEERYRTLFDSLNEGLGIQNKDGLITFINKRACEFFGYKSDELLGRPVSFLLDEKNQKILQEQMKHRHKGKHQSYEIAFRRKDGINVPTIVSPTPLFDENGGLEGSIAVFTDITELRRAEKAITLFRTLVDRSNDAIEVVDPETGQFLDMNDRGLLDLGYRREELPYLRVWDIDPAVDQSSFFKIIEELRRSGSVVLKSHHQRKDGSKFPVEINIKYIQLDRDYVITVARDITESKLAEEALKESEERFRSVAQAANDAIISADSSGRIISWNKGAHTIFGYSEEEVLGEPLIMLMPERYRDAHQKGFERLHTTGQSRIIGKTVELDGLRKDGAEFPLELSISTWGSGNARYCSGIIRDITGRKLAEEKIKHMAYHDSLTDLPNRALFYDRLHQAVLAGQRENGPVALILLDLDRFKEINDTAGHHYGDLVLQAVGLRLRGIVRKSDTVARLGGDEFALLLAGTNMEGATLTAHKILETIKAPFSLEGQVFNIGVSIGIALFPDHSEDSSLLMQKADMAMYRAKESGIGYALYVPGEGQG